MAAEEECECEECKPGLPAYLATFADLMSLLMCFFVLLLAFSEMDVQKYKQLAGSMKSAFGVQNKLKAEEIPKGTSIVAQEFSPGRPEPTPLNEVRQTTTDSSQNTLEVLCSPGQSQERENAKQSAEATVDQSSEILERLVAMTQADAMEVATMLKQDIQDGAVEVETKNRKIIIRVKEQGSFPSGSATLRPSFLPIMEKIREALKAVEGVYSIEGHTDDVPISTSRYRSNWELSTGRAVSVAQELFKSKELDQTKFIVSGFGETKPMVENDSKDNRARNRRVEIIIEQGYKDEQYLSGEEPLPEDPEFNVEKLKAAGFENLEGFNLLLEPDPQQNGGSGDEVISVLEPKLDDLDPGDRGDIEVAPGPTGRPAPNQGASERSRDPFGPSQSIREGEFF